MKTPLITVLSLCSPLAFAQAPATPVSAPVTAPVVAPAPTVSEAQTKAKAAFDARVKEFEAQRAERIKNIEAQRAEFDKMSKEYSEKMKAAKTPEEMQAVAEAHVKAMYEKAGIEMPKRPNQAEMMKKRVAHMEKMKALYDIKDPAERQKQLMAYQQEQQKNMRQSMPTPRMNVPQFMNGQGQHRSFQRMQNNPQFKAMQQQRMAQRKAMQEHQQKMQQDMQKRMAHMEKMMQDMHKQHMAEQPAPATPAPIVAPTPVAPAK